MCVDVIGFKVDPATTQSQLQALTLAMSTCKSLKVWLLLEAKGIDYRISKACAADADSVAAAPDLVLLLLRGAKMVVMSVVFVEAIR